MVAAVLGFYFAWIASSPAFLAPLPELKFQVLDKSCEFKLVMDMIRGHSYLLGDLLHYFLKG
jgi:hypothetical protein